MYVYIQRHLGINLYGILVELCILSKPESSAAPGIAINPGRAGSDFSMEVCKPHAS